MTSVGSMAARSGLRAGSALTIGVGVTDAYTKAANVLRPVGGRMFIASPQYAAINTDGTGAITNGSAVGLWRDYVTGGYGPELVTNGDFSNEATGWLPGPNWAVANGVASCDGSTTNYLQKANVFTANKTYRVEYQIVSIASGSINARASTSSLGSPRTSAGVYVEYLTPNESGGILNFIPAAGTVASIDNISVREVLALTQATAGKKLVARQVPILGPELVVNGDFSNGTTGWRWYQSSLSVSSGVAIVVATTGGGSFNVNRRLPSLVAGRSYVASVIRRNENSTGVRLFVQRGVEGGYASIANDPSSYSGIVPAVGSFVFTAPDSDAQVVVVGNQTAIGQSFVCDNISVREITGYTQQWEWVSDGSDDVLIGTPGPTLSDGLVMVWAGNNLSRTVGGRVAALVNAGATSWVAIYNEATGISARVMVASTTVNTVIAATTLGANYVAAIRLTGTNLQLRVNSGAWVTLAHGLTLNDVALIPAVGAQTTTANFANAEDAFASFANLGANATDANIRIIEEAAAKAAGVVLP